MMGLANNLKHVLQAALFIFAIAGVQVQGNPTLIKSEYQALEVAAHRAGVPLSEHLRRDVSTNIASCTTGRDCLITSDSSCCHDRICWASWQSSKCGAGSGGLCYKSSNCAASAGCSMDGVCVSDSSSNLRPDNYYEVDDTSLGLIIGFSILGFILFFIIIPTSVCFCAGAACFQSRRARSRPVDQAAVPMALPVQTFTEVDPVGSPQPTPAYTYRNADLSPQPIPASIHTKAALG